MANEKISKFSELRIDDVVGDNYKFSQDGGTIMFGMNNHFILVSKDLKSYSKSEILKYEDANFGSLDYFNPLYPLNGGEYVYYQAYSFSWTDENNFILFNKQGEVVNTLF